MTSYEDKGEKPKFGRFTAFDHLTFWVSNAKQAATYYVTRFGFEYLAYRGLETDSRKYAEYAVRMNKIVFILKAQYEPNSDTEFAKQVGRHGDFVKDVAFEVEDLDRIVEYAKKQGAEIVRDIWEERDEGGVVRMATLKTYGDNTHTLVDRKGYKGFLPGFEPLPKDPLVELLPKIDINFIDHVVGNQPENKMNEAASWYERVLQFHKFWSVDEKQVSTQYSALRSTVMANYEETVKVPINEPAKGLKKSQIQEYVEYHGGAGVQHIAINTEDIISAVSNLKKRGLEFLSIPHAYYEKIREALKHSKVRVAEDLAMLEKLNILIDYDDNGYLLQIFSKNTQDKPTLFIEVIQRRNHNGFGAGNFKTLFECIEIDQKSRGNL